MLVGKYVQQKLHYPNTNIYHILPYLSYYEHFLSIGKYVQQKLHYPNTNIYHILPYLSYYEHFLSTRLICSDSVRFVKVLLGADHNTNTFPTLCDECVGSLTSPINQYREDAGDGGYGFSYSSENTRMSNRLQISKAAHSPQLF